MTYPLKITDEGKALQKTTLERLTGGLNFLNREDQIDPSEALRCEGLQLRKGRLYQDTGYTAFADVIQGTPQTDYQFFKKAGTSELMLVTTASLYKYVAGADQWQFVKGTASTTVTLAAGAGVTNVEVASSAGFSPTDLVGVELDSGLQHRTTVASIPDGTHITLTAGIPAGANAGVANVVVRAVALSGDLDHHVVVDTVASHDWFVFTNGVDKPQRYNGTDCVVIPNLPSAGNTVCKALRVYNKALFLLNTTEGGTVRPQRVRRSDIGDPENWTTGTAGFDDLLDSADFILAGEILGPYLIVYRERAIERGEFIGQGGLNYKFDRMIEGEGTISTGGVVNLGDYHIVLGNANIYEYRAGFDLNPIGDKIQPHIFGTSDAILNPSFKTRSFTLFVEELNEVWLFLPTTASETCDLLLRYNISEENFAERRFFHKFIGYGFYIRQGGLEWGLMPSGSAGFWENQVWKWGGTAIAANSPVTHLCATSGGQVYEYDYLAENDSGNAISFAFETKDFISSEAKIRLDTIEGFLRGTGVLVEYSTNEGQSWISVGSVTNASNSKFLLGKQDVTQRVRFRISGSDVQFMLSFFEFYWKLETAR